MNRKGLFSWSGFGGVVKGNPPGTTLQFTPFGRTFTGAFGYDGINTGLDVAGCTVVCAGAFMDIQVGDLYPHKVRGRGGPCGAACGLFCGWGCNYLKFGFSPKTVPANIAKKLPPQRCSKPLFIAFSTSRTNGSRLLSQAKAGTHSPSPTGSHTRAYTPKQVVFRMGVVSLPSIRAARSRISPGRVSERRTLPLLGLGRGCSQRTQRAFGTAMRLCASLSRGVAAPLGCVIQ